MKIQRNIVFLCIATAALLFVYATPSLRASTPAEEDACASLTGALKGLCNAYCEAMDCDSDDSNAAACAKVLESYEEHSGGDPPPCEGSGFIDCSGFGGLPCPEGSVCFDQPGDACDVPCAADCIGFCVEIPVFTCGGIAGLPCPAGLTCVDDPADNCDVDCGGADCGGICREVSDDFCGGFAGFPCPSGFECRDAKGDGCSPDCGGADCGGQCERDAAPVCGGIAGLACPIGLICIDDPSDLCAPDCRGSDCIGICVDPR